MATLEKLTAAAFGQRRKMLRQSLKALPGALDALEATGIAADRRPETVDIFEWCNLARQLG
jgi:16S rRNA (adenine1518-N6/adenine1519-N6)-dimethyltransferase